MQPTIRLLAADDAPGITAYVQLRASITPDDADSVENAAWEDATYPGQVFRLLALVDGTPVGVATTGRLHIYPADHPAYYLGCWVLADWRRRGIGTALLEAASGIARAHGKSGFRTWISEGRTEGVEFLERRGFEVIGRDKIVTLHLEGLAPPPVLPPPGFEITTLAARPDLAEGLWRVAVEAFPAIPATTPVDPGPLEEFLARDVNHVLIPQDALAIAIETRTGEVAGYAALKLAAGEARIAYHDMTAVRPAFQSRGLATALKRATIAWAIAAGLDELRTGNDEDNAPMRAVNAALGYTPRPDYLAMRGQLTPAT